MKQIIVIICLVISTKGTIHAQDSVGLTLGGSIGVSLFTPGSDDRYTNTNFNWSFPNLTIGWKFSKRTVLLVYLPGSLYKFGGSNTEVDRGFEGVIPSIQFWPLRKLWVMAGSGIALDALAVYEYTSKSSPDIFLGRSTFIAVGYEVWQGRLSADIQSRIHVNSFNLKGNLIYGETFSIMIGLRLNPKEKLFEYVD